MILLRINLPNFVQLNSIKAILQMPRFVTIHWSQSWGEGAKVHGAPPL